MQQSDKILFYIKRIFGALLLIALGCVFIYSGYTKSGVVVEGFKLYANDSAFDNFQWTFLDFGINSIFVAEILARLMVGLELLLGLFLIFHIYLRTFTYKAVIGILLIFIIYLIIIIVKQGNNGNCGCFGDKIAMTPLNAIWKNLILMGITLILWFIYPIRPYKLQEYACLLLGLIAISLPFVFNNIYTDTNPIPYKKAIDLNPLYANIPPPQVELRKGKHIVSFMSLTCPHCKKAAHLCSIIHKEHADIPIYFVLAGHESLLNKFFTETESINVPHLLFQNSKSFDEMINAGVDSGQLAGVPAIYWINNGKIEFKSTYYRLDPKYIYEWLKKND